MRKITLDNIFTILLLIVTGLYAFLYVYIIINIYPKAYEGLQSLRELNTTVTNATVYIAVWNEVLVLLIMIPLLLLILVLMHETAKLRNRVRELEKLSGVRESG